MSDDILGLIVGILGGGAGIVAFLGWQTRRALREAFGP